MTASPRRRPVVRALVAGLCLLALSGCGLFGSDDAGQDAPAAGADPEELPLVGWDAVPAADVAEGGVLRLGVSTLPVTFDPVTDDASVGPGTSDLERILAPTTGGAVRVTDDGGWEVDEAYAESVEVTEESDPLTVSVRLNAEAVWSDGEPIVAADMVAFHRYLESRDPTDPAIAEGWSDVADVEADGEHAYTVRFERPRSDWPRFVYPRLPRSVTGGDADVDLSEQPPPSNGPFMVTDVDLEAGIITQEPNPRWWGRAPRLDQVVWRVATPEVQAEAYAADELDVVDVDTASADGLDPALLRRSAGAQWSHLTLNGGSGPLADADVRRAVALALDREALAADSVRGLDSRPQVAESLFTVPGQEGHADAASDLLPHDPDAARGLLEDAGYDVGEGQATRDGDQLTLRLPVPTDSPTVERRAGLVREQLAQVGIAVEVQEVAADDFSTQVLLPRDFDLVTFSWDAALLGVAPQQSRYRPVDSADNVTGVSSGSPEQWSGAIGALDDARHEATAALDAAVLEQHVVLPLAVQPVVRAVRDGVVNVGPSTFAAPDWTAVGLAADDED